MIILELIDTRYDRPHLRNKHTWNKKALYVDLYLGDKSVMFDRSMWVL